MVNFGDARENIEEVRRNIEDVLEKIFQSCGNIKTVREILGSTRKYRRGRRNRDARQNNGDVPMNIGDVNW